MSDPISLFISIGSGLKTATDIAIGLGKLKTMAEVNARPSSFRALYWAFKATLSPHRRNNLRWFKE